MLHQVTQCQECTGFDADVLSGGIDLAGIFPKYINIRRGAIITFLAIWICQ
jgi:cytosine/uracil/thiamine/allantoin permease